MSINERAWNTVKGVLHFILSFHFEALISLQIRKTHDQKRKIIQLLKHITTLEQSKGIEQN